MPIDKAQVQQASQLIESRLGLSNSTLERIGLAELIEQASNLNPEDFLRQLRTGDEHSPAWQRLIHALTIGETYFMRDSSHFAILRENILPRLILERRQANDLRLNICSVGCATGEEAYSIAATLHENIPDLSNWRINLYAMDINQRALDTAKRGIYRDWSFRQTPAQFKQRYFTQVEEGWQIALQLRNMVSFLRMNILTGMPSAQLDIVFCRHVLMYFQKSHAEKAEANLYQSLNLNGWLIMGQAEALRSKRESWLLHMFPGTPIYQKVNPSHKPETISYPTRPQKPEAKANPDFAAHYKRAVDAIHQDQIETAEFHLSRLLEDAPQEPRAHLLLAALLANRQAYPEALTHIEAALEIDSLIADAHYLKALILLEQEDDDSAIQSFSAAIYCQRNHALASFSLGNLYYQKDDKQKAERNWKNAQRALDEKSGTDFVSDISDMTASRLKTLLENALASLNGNYENGKDKS